MSFRDIPIDDLELSVRSANALKGAGYTTLGSLQDLFEKPKTEVLKTLKHFGAKSYWEVYQILDQPKKDDRFRIEEWVRHHHDTIRAIIDARAVVVRAWKDTDA
jgi:DNA-directed RNA polymerase subunit alpha